MKKSTLKKVAIGVACVLGMGVFSFIYIEQHKTLNEQVAIIENLEDLHREETEKVSTLSLENEQLATELESARSRSAELRDEIGRDEAEIEKIKIELANSGLPTTNGRTIRVKVTGYCPCAYCCGEWAYKNPGITASGTVAKYGTIAAPTSLPFGTQMYIEGYGNQVFTVEDTGSAVVYSDGVYVIDMWMPTHEQAYAVGNSIVNAIILE